VQANRFLVEGNVRRDKRKEKVDKMAAAILLQSYSTPTANEPGARRLATESAVRWAFISSRW